MVANDMAEYVNEIFVALAHFLWDMCNGIAVNPSSENPPRIHIRHNTYKNIPATPLFSNSQEFVLNFHIYCKAKSVKSVPCNSLMSYPM